MEKRKSTKCKIDEVVINSSRALKPALINFAEGVLQEESAKKFKCQLIEDSDDENLNKEPDMRERSRMFLIGDINEQFVGNVMPNETAMCHTMLMIRNKETNKLQLIEVDQYNVVKLIDKIDDSDDSSDGIEELYEKKRDSLYKTFGSKRSLRTLDLGNKTKVNIEVMKKQMEKSSSKITVNTEDLEVSDGKIDVYLPKCNREAKKPEDVYRLEDMLSPEELESLDEVTEKVLSDPPTESPEGSEFSSFFVSALKYVGEKRNSTHIKCLLFADAILYFLKLKMGSLRKEKIFSTVCPFSKAVSEKILEEFTIKTKSGRLRPEQVTDKAVCWIVILTVIACKFSLDTALVSPHLLNRQLDIHRFEKILRVLGLSPLNGGYWMLRTPLPPVSNPKFGLLQKSKRK